MQRARFPLRILAAAAVGALALVSGCHKKATPSPPAPAQAPALRLPPFPGATGPQQTPPAATTPTTTTPPPTPQPVDAQSTSGRHLHHSGKDQAKTPPNPATPGAGNAPAPPEQISVGMEESEAAHQRQVTQELLDSTETILKRLTRALTADEAAMLEQIKAYMAQARSALSDGDVVRAGNLAQKARLLAEALGKR